MGDIRLIVERQILVQRQSLVICCIAGVLAVAKLLVLEKLLILSPQQSHNVCGKLRYFSRLLQVAVYVLISAENMGVA